MPERNDRYPGTTAKTHGERNDTTPAAAAASTGMLSTHPPSVDLIDQSGDERPVLVRVPVGFEGLLANDPGGVDQEGLWHTDHLIGLHDSPGRVMQDVERQPELARELAYALLRTAIVNADGDHAQP